MNKPVAHAATRLLLFWNRLRQSKNDFDFSSLRSVLFIETSKMGDVVSMLPLLNDFHDAHSHLELHVAVDERYTDIIKCVPFVSTVIGLSKTQSLIGFLRATKQLKSVHADLSISVSPSHRNALFALSTTSVYKIGYFDCMTSTTPFLYQSDISTVGFTMTHPKTFYLENISERPLKIARALDIVTHQRSSMLYVPGTIINENENLLEKLKINNEPFVVLHPFSGWFYRSWDVQNYLSLADVLATSKIHTFIIGGKEEQSLLSSHSLTKNSNIHLFFGEPLERIIGLLHRASLFIGNDSGPLHLATALGVPCIGLFGPAAPHLTAPPSQRNIYFHETVECSPCEQRTCIRPENPCINLISREQILNAVFAVLEKSSAVKK